MTVSLEVFAEWFFFSTRSILWEEILKRGLNIEVHLRERRSYEKFNFMRVINEATR